MTGACFRCNNNNQVEIELSPFPLHSAPGRLYCKDHLHEIREAWLRDTTNSRKSIAAQIAASMAVGFNGKSHEEIVKISFDLAELIEMESIRRRGAP